MFKRLKKTDFDNITSLANKNTEVIFQTRDYDASNFSSKGIGKIDITTYHVPNRIGFYMIYVRKPTGKQSSVFYLNFPTIDDVNTFLKEKKLPKIKPNE